MHAKIILKQNITYQVFTIIQKKIESCYLVHINLLFYKRKCLNEEPNQNSRIMKPTDLNMQVC